MDGTKISLSVEADLDLVAQSAETERIIEIAVNAPTAVKRGERPALNLALVLDRSGSMSGDKIVYAKKAALHVLDLLDERDQVALVIYDDNIDVLSKSVPVTPSNRETVKQLLKLVESRGSTALCGGWLTGCEQIAGAARNGSLNRALLLTDGLANVGITDPEQIATHAYELAQRGITTSTFGIGLGYNHTLLEAISNRGGGSYYFIETPAEIPGIFLREFNELSTATALEVEVGIEIPAGVELEALGDWSVRHAGGSLLISLGSMFSARRQPLYFKAKFEPAMLGAQIPLQVGLKGEYEDGSSFEVRSQIMFRAADPQIVSAAPRNSEMLARYAEVEIAQVSSEALKLEHQGLHAQASAMVMNSLMDNAKFLDDAQLVEYKVIAKEMARGMDESERKQRHFQSYERKRSRPN